MQLANDRFGLQWEVVDLKQRHIEKFSELHKEFEEGLPMPKYRGQVVRAAIDSGWIVFPVVTAADVAELTAAAVRWLSERITDIYVEANEIDPKV